MDNKKMITFIVKIAIAVSLSVNFGDDEAIKVIAWLLYIAGVMDLVGLVWSKKYQADNIVELDADKFTSQICTNCGSKIDIKFDECPVCGSQIKN